MALVLQQPATNHQFGPLSPIMSTHHRHELGRFRSLLDSYVDAIQPARCLTLAQNMLKLLNGMSKRMFIICVDELLQKAFTAEPHKISTFVSLFEQIAPSAIKLDNGQLFPISQAISGYCMKHPENETMADVERFRMKLPLLNELYKMNLIQRGFFKFFAKMFANMRHRGQVSGKFIHNFHNFQHFTLQVPVAFLYEIVHNVNLLCESMPDWDEQFWNQCMLVLQDALTDSSITDASLLSNIHILMSSLRKNRRFSPSKALHGSNNNHRRELISPIDDPAIVKMGQPLKSPMNGHHTPLPADHDSKHRSAASAVRVIMQCLVNHPENLTLCCAQVQRLLEAECSVSKESFVAAVDEMLNEMLLADSRTFNNYVHMLEHLVKTLPPVQFRKAVVQSAMQIHRLETVDHVIEFCSSFRLSNQLCRLGLLQSHVFKHYVNELAKPERDLSYLFMYQVMRNVDKLIDSGFATLTYAEQQFWETCATRLTKACPNRALVSSEKEHEVYSFLDNVRQKGGWGRRPQMITKIQPQPILQKGKPFSYQFPRKFKKKKRLISVDVPSLIVSSAKTSPIMRVQSSMSTPSPVCPDNMMQDMDFRGLIDVMSLADPLFNADHVVQQFRPKLMQISSQFFTEAVEIFLAKIFLQMDNDKVVENAAKLCIAFYRQDFGSGKNFTLELQKACLKYLSTNSKCKSESERIQLERLLKLKNMGCIRLVAKLFEMKHLNFQFLISLVDSLVARKSEEGLECLLELFNRIGREFESQAVAKGMMEWWANFFEELATIGSSSDSNDKTRALVAEILRSKKVTNFHFVYYIMKV